MRRNTKLLLGILVGTIISTTVLATNPSNNTDPEKKEKEIERYLRKIKSNPDFSMFMQAFEKTHLKNRLIQLDEYTLLIPDNKAFKKLPEDVYENFLKEENLDDLEKVLSYHIIPKKLDKEDMSIRDQIKSLEGAILNINNAEEISIENATLKDRTMKKPNVVIFSVNELILPM